MSQLVDFYLGVHADAAGRHLEEIWNWNDEQWEEVHDYIQWLFPTVTRSAYHPSAPLLTDEDIRLFQANSELRNRLRKSFVRFLRFAGLELNEEDRVVEGVNFDKRCPEVWKYENHNWLRVSRVLASLHLLGLKGESKAFLAWLEGAYRAGTGARREAASSLEHWAKHTRD